MTGHGRCEAVLVGLLLAGCGGDTLWARQSTGPGLEHASDVDHDATGAVVVAGNYGGTADLGGGALPAGENAERSLFLARYTPGGAHVWSRGFVPRRPWFSFNSGTPRARLAVDPLGNASVSLRLVGPTDLGGGLSVAGNVLLRFAPDGALAWWRELHPDVIYTSGSDSLGLASDQQGQTLLVTQAGVIDTESGRHTVDRGYLAAWSVGGTLLWEQSLKGEYWLDGAAADGFDRWLVSGVRRSGTDRALRVMQLANDGGPRWSVDVAIGALEVDRTSITASGDLVVVGLSARSGLQPASLTFAGRTFTFVEQPPFDGGWRSEHRGLVLAFDAAGTPLWMRQVGTEVSSVSLRGAQLVVVGRHSAGVPLDTGTWPVRTTGFVAALASADGTGTWSRHLTPTTNVLRAVDHAPTGGVTVVGDFWEVPQDLGPVVLTPTGGNYDALVWRLAP